MAASFVKAAIWGALETSDHPRVFINHVISVVSITHHAVTFIQVSAVLFKDIVIDIAAIVVSPGAVTAAGTST